MGLPKSPQYRAAEPVPASPWPLTFGRAEEVLAAEPTVPAHVPDREVLLPKSIAREGQLAIRALRERSFLIPASKVSEALS